MREVTDALERLQPATDGRGHWEGVLRDAGLGPRRALARPLSALAAAVAAVSALALFQPWESESPTVLERALAAVDDGPILHAVLRGEWGGTLVDLESGDREPVYGENEVWYDPDRGLVHQITRIGGVVENELVYEPRQPPADLAALGRRYRQALQTGSARVASEETIDGERVSWITIRSERNLDVADNRLHGWAEQVAVSHDTYKPVALRETRDGVPVPMTGRRVLELEMLTAGDADFTAPRRSQLEGISVAYQPFSGELTREQAGDVLERRPLWAGPRLGDLEFARIGLTETRRFRVRVIRRGRVVRVTGPRQEIDSVRGIVLFYGQLGDDPTTYREDNGPRWDRPHVAVTESTRRSFGPRGSVGYVPPRGSVFLQAGGRSGSLEVGDVYVSVEATNEELILSAARALEPMPG